MNTLLNFVATFLVFLAINRCIDGSTVASLASSMKSPSHGHILTNSFLVQFHQDTDRRLADQVALRNGFINRGPVRDILLQFKFLFYFLESSSLFFDYFLFKHHKNNNRNKIYTLLLPQKMLFDQICIHY